MNHYQFKVGNFSCIALSDGGLNYPIESVFPFGEQTEAILRPLGLFRTYVYSPYTLLYIQTDSYKVMVDTGMGGYGKLADQLFDSQ